MAKRRLFKIYTTSNYVKTAPIYVESDRPIKTMKELCNGIQAYYFKHSRIPARYLIPEILVAEVLCEVFACNIVEEKYFTKYENYDADKQDVRDSFMLDLQKDYEKLPFERTVTIAKYLESIWTNDCLQRQFRNIDNLVSALEIMLDVDFSKMGKIDVITV